MNGLVGGVGGGLVRLGGGLVGFGAVGVRCVGGEDGVGGLGDDAEVGGVAGDDDARRSGEGEGGGGGVFDGEGVGGAAGEAVGAAKVGAVGMPGVLVPSAAMSTLPLPPVTSILVTMPAPERLNL